MKSLPLRANIVTIFVVLLVSTVSFIVFYSYQSNSKSMLKQAENLVYLISNKGIEKTIQYLEPAAISAQMSATLIEQKTLPFENINRIDQYAIEAIKSYPQLAMFDLGDTQGNFLLTKKMPNKTISTKIMKRTKSQTITTWIHRNHNGKIIKKETFTNDSYDPRKRPWYKSALKNEGISWTDLYIFFTDQKPGLTASYPIKDTNGKLQGVVGIDIELSKISHFLKSLNISKNSTTLIINNKGEVVAYPDISKITIKENGNYRLAKVSELNTPWISEAYNIFQKQKQKKVHFNYKGKDYLASFLNFPKSFKKDWLFAVVVPEDDFTSILKQTNQTSVIVSIIILVIGILLISFISKMISTPISLITEETEKIKNFHFDKPLNINSYITEIQKITQGMNAMKSGLKAFEKYVPSTLVRELVRNSDEAGLGGENREMTIFFSDIAGFTPISETMPPKALMSQLTVYFSEATEVIKQHNGTVDKFIGDCIMAFWGAPTKSENHAELACHSALLCQKKIKKLNNTWQKEGITPFPTRIGLHSGTATVGNLGSVDRMNYTVLGDSVNLASRLESVNKIYGTEIVVSESTYQQVKDKFIFRLLDKVAVKGKSQSVNIYELITTKEEKVSPEQQTFITEFETALACFMNREWAKAQNILEKLQVMKPDDMSLALYIKRCHSYRATPPPTDWNGSSILNSK